MTQGLARYHSRAPRYILDTEDNYLIRVAGPQQTPWEEGTEIKNVSLTGLVFSAPEDLCPVLGEVIKIQFQVPGSQSMACYALVIRVDEEGPQIKNVAVHFYKLEMAHRMILAQGLLQKIKAKNLDSENLAVAPNHFAKLLFHTLILSLLMGLWSWLMVFWINTHDQSFQIWLEHWLKNKF